MKSQTETTKPEARDESGDQVERVVGLQQTIFEHGGSRIWIDRNGHRNLLVDTYGPDASLAQAVMECIRTYLQPNKIIAPALNEKQP